MSRAAIASSRLMLTLALAVALLAAVGVGLAVATIVRCWAAHTLAPGWAAVVLGRGVIVTAGAVLVASLARLLERILTVLRP